jgi:hypothetical protein
MFYVVCVMEMEVIIVDFLWQTGLKIIVIMESYQLKELLENMKLFRAPISEFLIE